MLRGVVIQNAEASPRESFPPLTGAIADPVIESRHVISSGSSLEAWVHDMPAGSKMRWQAPVRDHLFYVWKGALSQDGNPVASDQVIVVEHGATAMFVAGPEGATLVHFHHSESQPQESMRAGGQVHVAPVEGMFTRLDEARAATHRVWVDAHCPTCELWLHKSSFSRPRLQSEPHLHNEDEIIFVTEGSILVGKAHPAGTAIAVAKGTVYTFGVGPGGGAFINFRACNPLVKMIDRGKPVGDWMSERSFMRNEITVPVVDPRAALQP